MKDLKNKIQRRFYLSITSFFVFVCAIGLLSSCGVSGDNKPVTGEKNPFGTNIYVRGGFNGWGTDNKMDIKGGMLRTSINIPSGEYEFKCADAGWATWNMGGPDNTLSPIKLDTAFTLRPAANPGNLVLTITEGGIYNFTINPADTSNPILTVSKDATIPGPYGIKLYIRGSMNLWGLMHPLEFSANKYTAKILMTGSTEPYEFKIADEKWTDWNYTGKIAGSKVQISYDGKENPVEGTSSGFMTYTATETGTYVFSIDVSEDITKLAKPVLSVGMDNPYGTTIFVRGGMNGWGATDKFSYSGSLKTYELKLTIAKGSYEFKIADANWASINIGAPDGDDGVLSLGTSKQLVNSSNPGNLKLTVSADGEFTFKLDPSDKTKPLLTVLGSGSTYTPSYESNIYVRGGMNSWGTSNKMSFNYSNGNYEATINLDAGTYEFKIGDENWTSINIGASNATDISATLDSEKTLLKDANPANLKLVVTEKKDYLFSLNAKDSANAPKLKVSVPVGGPDGNLRVYYNRFNSDYTDWGLHLWGNALTTDGVWTSPLLFNKTDEFGMYVDIPIKKSGTLNFIIHKGDQKDTSIDRVFPSLASNPNCWLIQDDTTVYTAKPSIALQIRSVEFLSATMMKALLSADKPVTKEELVIKDSDGVSYSLTTLEKENATITITTNAPLSFSKNYIVILNKGEDYVSLSRDLLKTSDFAYDGDDLGATLNQNGSVTFKLWSPPATAVKVYIYDKTNQTTQVGDATSLTRGDKGIWSATVSSLGGVTNFDKYFYQYEVTAYGKTTRALDPYSKSMASFKGDFTGAPTDSVGKGAIIDFNASSAGSRPSHLTNIMKNKIDMIAYEVHVRDFTSKAADVPETLRGTFTGFKQKIDHLKDLGITHVQLLPVQNQYRPDETNRAYQDENQTTPNYNWGYDPHCYASLEGWFSTDSTDPYKRIAEFRDLVSALHAQGIGVIVDVVYNHTYNMTIFENVAPGCYHRAKGGSTPVGDPAVESRTPMVRKMIVDTLKMFVNEYGVDGFRFDLMGFIDTVTMKEIRQKLGDDIILHGEAWNFTDLPVAEAPIKGIYATYPHGINLGVFNDTSRDSYAGRESAKGFIQGQYSDNPKCKAGLIAGIVGFTNGGNYVHIDTDDYNIFADSPEETLQFLTIHDGYTLWDKINLSFKGTAAARAKMVKQATAMLFTSQGKIILHAGEEIGRTKPKAVNDPVPDRAHTSTLVDEDSDLPGVTYFHENTYRSSDYTNHIRWERKDNPVFKGIYDYYKGLITMRRSIPALRYAKTDSIKNGVRFFGETAPTGGGDTTVYAGYKTFDDVKTLKINFIKGPANTTCYIAGEVHNDPSVNNPPSDNPFVVSFDGNGDGNINFTEAQVNGFDLDKWGDTKVLNFKLVRTQGAWDAIEGAYTQMGNNNIRAEKIEQGDFVTVNLSIVDHTPGVIAVDAAHFIAYELDNTLETDGSNTNYNGVIVIHNAEPSAITVTISTIADANDWVVIMDEDDAGITPLTYDANADSQGETAVKVINSKVIVPANSSTVIARKSN